MADAVATAAASLVTVNGRERQSATGIVIAPEQVLTADHVLERDDALTVINSDGHSLPATLIGRDPGSDLALLKVAGLSARAIADAPAARVGQLVLAVGRPGDEGVMASHGVVSAIGGPVRMGRSHIERYIRTDATPYPGFSGGALIDANGAALGLLTTGLARGVALVLPMDLARKVAGTLASQGHVKRGFLGMVSQQVKLPPAHRSAAHDNGLLIVKIEDDSPAEKGGLLVGDIVTAFDGNRVQDADDLLAQLAGAAGRTLLIDVIRGGAATRLNITVGSR